MIPSTDQRLGMFRSFLDLSSQVKLLQEQLIDAVIVVSILLRISLLSIRLARSIDMPMCFLIMTRNGQNSCISVSSELML